MQDFFPRRLAGCTVTVSALRGPEDPAILPEISDALSGLAGAVHEYLAGEFGPGLLVEVEILESPGIPSWFFGAGGVSP